jgi:hypothetical protein
MCSRLAMVVTNSHLLVWVKYGTSHDSLRTMKRQFAMLNDPYQGQDVILYTSENVAHPGSGPSLGRDGRNRSTRLANEGPHVPLQRSQDRYSPLDRVIGSSSNASITNRMASEIAPPYHSSTANSHHNCRSRTWRPQHLPRSYFLDPGCGERRRRIREAFIGLAA